MLAAISKTRFLRSSTGGIIQLRFLFAEGFHAAQAVQTVLEGS